MAGDAGGATASQPYFKGQTHKARWRADPGHEFSLGQHHLTPLDLMTAETSRGLAMWADDGWLAGDRNLEVRMVTRIDGFLKCNKPCARWMSAPNGEVPLRRCTKIIVGARQSDGASPFRMFERYPVTGLFDLEIFRRRFSAVAYNFELDLPASLSHDARRRS